MAARYGLIRGHRVVGVRNCNDPRDERNVVAADLVGVPLAIHTFVVVANDHGDISVRFNLGENALADL